MALPGLVAANNLSDVADRERAWDNLGSSLATGDIAIPAPSLDLNFAANKSLVDDISGNNLITFSRASSGTFVGSNGFIQTAASGVPRFDHNPVTGESLGLLVEEARTNDVRYSEQFDNSYWTKVQATVIPNATLAPDGALTGDLLFTATTGAAGFSRAVGGIASSPYTTTIYLKSAGFAWAYVYGAQGNHFAFFNLINGTVGSKTAGITASSISSAGDGWYRCTVTQTVTFRNFAAGPADADGSTTSTASGTSGIYIWGAQVEAGSFPTSYIPTVASTVTRAVDVVSITGANFSGWYNATQGTLLGSGTPRSTSIANQFIGCLSDNSDSNFIGLARSYTNNITDAGFGVFASGPSQAGISVAVGSWISLQKRSLIGAYAVNDFAFSFNGGTVGTDLSGSIPTVTQFRIGGATAPSPSPFNGAISRLTYWPSRLNNKALQYITQSSISSINVYSFFFAIKGRDVLALEDVRNTSTRDFIFIKGLLSAAQPRLTAAAASTASGTFLRDNALLKASPTSAGNYAIPRAFLDASSLRINGIQAASISTAPFSGSTATVPLSISTLSAPINLRFTQPMTSGTVTGDRAIPIDTGSFILYAKAGQG